MGPLAKGPASLQLLPWSSGRKALGVPKIILSPDHLKVGRAWRELLVAFPVPFDKFFDKIEQRENPEEQ